MYKDINKHNLNIEISADVQSLNTIGCYQDLMVSGYQDFGYEFEYEYFIKHDFHIEDGYATWTLDYTMESDIEDSVGSWTVVPHEEKPGWSTFYYTVDMRLRGWMPGFIRDFLSTKGMKNATEWIKRESERVQREIDAGDST